MHRALISDKRRLPRMVQMVHKCTLPNIQHFTVSYLSSSEVSCTMASQCVRLFKRFVLLVLLGLVACNAPSQPQPSPSSPWVWPLSGSTTPDFPFSSTFGPRLQASQSFRYDFHRGIDIPTPEGTALHAVADGVVRIAGSHPSYQDGVIQLQHGDCSRSCYFSNYLHIKDSLVSVAQEVKQGEVMGHSGIGESGFPHLHFEIRQNGFFQKDAVHPLLVLPYPNNAPPKITVKNVDTSVVGKVSVTVSVEINPSELDLKRVSLVVFDDKDQKTDERGFDMLEWNQLYTPEDDPHCCLDNPEFNNLSLAPSRFSASSETYELSVTFRDLVRSDMGLKLEITAEDVGGKKSQLNYP